MCLHPLCAQRREGRPAQQSRGESTEREEVLNILGRCLRPGLSTHTPAGLKRKGRYPFQSITQINPCHSERSEESSESYNYVCKPTMPIEEDSLFLRNAKSYYMHFNIAYSGGK